MTSNIARNSNVTQCDLIHHAGLVKSSACTKSLWAPRKSCKSKSAQGSKDQHGIPASLPSPHLVSKACAACSCSTAHSFPTMEIVGLCGQARDDAERRNATHSEEFGITNLRIDFKIVHCPHTPAWKQVQHISSYFYTCVMNKSQSYQSYRIISSLRTSEQARECWGSSWSTRMKQMHASHPDMLCIAVYCCVLSHIFSAFFSCAALAACRA